MAENEPKRKRRGYAVLAFLLFVLLVIMIAAPFVLVYGGWYNVAASVPHTAFGEWYLETMKDRSVQEHAAGIQVPELTDDMAQRGYSRYAAMCQMCHAAPGVNRREFAKGLLPLPPRLAEELHEWTTAEVYWIVEHGIKMTGMSSFGQTHKPEELWEIVAFVEKLPDMTAEEYKAYGAASASPDGHEHEQAEAGHGD